MTTLVIADDHQLLREGLSAVLDAQPDLTVVGQAGDGRAAIEAVARLRPDVLIVDLSMPGGLSGIDVVRDVKERFPRVRMIVVSMHSTE